MDVSQATQGETEAQLEARARGALLKALPWLDGRDLQQQISFTIRFGHAVVTVDGKEREHITGRCDMLVTLDGRPLLVIELKRPQLGINEYDVEQGLSYARVLHPRPPLVMVTDGDQRRFVETHSGEEWRPVTKDEEALKALLDSAALVAADDMKRAVSRLLGVDPKAWVEAVRAVSDVFVEEREGGWDMPELPFVEDFLLPRRAVRDTIAALEAGARLTLIEGDPLIGKSSALRALAVELAKSKDFAVLVLDADAGIDLFTALADILSAHIFWPITPHEARHWVQQLSRTQGPALVLAVDDFDGARGSFRRDLEVLTSQLFGDRVRVVLALDTGAGYRLRTASNGRTPSALMRRKPERQALMPLDDAEFEEARDHLLSHGVKIMDGGERAKEYRLPWVLRAMCAAILSQAALKPGAPAVIPSLPTLQLLEWAKLRRDEGDAGPLAYYREVARAVLKDAETGDYSPALKLQSLEAYVVRREALREQLGEFEIRELIDSGLLHEGRRDTGEPVCFPKLQAQLAVELSRLLAEQIVDSDDPAAMGRHLAGFAANLPLGPVLAADAIFEAAQAKGSLDFALIAALQKIEPKAEAMPVGQTSVGRMPDGTMFEITGLEGNRIELRVGEHSEIIDDDGAQSIADIDAWLILSYLATRRIVVDSNDEQQTARLDGVLMLEIGAYPAPLVRADVAADGIEIHQLPNGVEALCHDAGIFEPITYAMAVFFSREPEYGAAFIAAALERESLALMLRIDAALRQVARFEGDAGTQAATLRTEAVRPALDALMAKQANRQDPN